jgi:hypothetical protein
MQSFCKNLGLDSMRQEPVLLFLLEPGFAISGPNIYLTPQQQLAPAHPIGPGVTLFISLNF